MMVPEFFSFINETFRKRLSSQRNTIRKGTGKKARVSLKTIPLG